MLLPKITRPKVSVCIPAYNRQEYLKNAIKSVLEQTFDNFELIISDDYSPTDLRLVVSEYKDKRIKYFRQKNNLGFIKNWNFCLNQCSGEYIKIMGDDDILLNDCIENQLAGFLNKNVGLVYSNLLIINENDLNVDEINNKNIYKLFDSDKIINGSNFIKKYFLGELKVGLPTAALFRRDIIKKIGLFDENIGCPADIDMWLRIMTLFDFYYSDKIAIKCRIHTENLSKKLIQNKFSFTNDLSMLYKHKAVIKTLNFFDKIFIFKKYFYLIRKAGFNFKIFNNTYNLFLFLFL
ncbi:MAG: glycosyltransferase family 2 protein [Patescibacteria group bacterium]